MVQLLITLVAKGLAALRAHRQLWLVATFAIILPMLFAIAAYSVFSITRANLASYEKLIISSAHEAIVVHLTTQATPDIKSAIQVLVASDATISGIAIFKLERAATTVVPVIVAQVGVELPLDSDPASQFALGLTGQTFITNIHTGAGRTIRGYRSLIQDQYSYLIATAHDYSAYDKLVQSRSYAFYAVFSLLTTALCGLAYYLATSVSYKTRYDGAVKTLSEQALVASSVVHELRAPLTAIRGYASMIGENSTVPNTIRAQANTIMLSAERLVALVSDFLTVSTLERSALPTLVPCDLARVAAQVVTELGPLAHEKHLTIGVRADTPVSPIQADEKLLLQIFTNLVNNAIKYTPQGHIEVLLETQGRHVEVRIKDTGLGMSADDQKRLFAPFARVGDEQSRAIVGTGLGMWITKLMVERLNGTIGIESIRGVGTHVVVRFKKA